MQWLSLCSTSSFELKCRGFQALVSQGVGTEWGGGQHRWTPLHWHVPVDSPSNSLLWEWVRCLAEGWALPHVTGVFRQQPKVPPALSLTWVWKPWVWFVIPGRPHCFMALSWNFWTVKKVDTAWFVLWCWWKHWLALENGWLLGVVLFLNISSHAWCELLSVPTEAQHWCSHLFNRYMGWREPDTCLERRPQPPWSCPPWAGHCWQAGCSQRSGASASSCPPASSSAWPSGWVAGRSLHRGHRSDLLAPIVLPKVWCWSADQKAISQLRVIGVPFSNWAASTHSQSLLEVWAVFVGWGSPLLFFCCFLHFIISEWFCCL